MIRVDVRRKAYGETEVLAEIAFAVQPGETVAVLGASGVGKTTLLRLIAGTDIDFSGSIERSDNIAMVFQEPVLLPWRSALQNIMLVHPDIPRDRALAVMDRVGLGDKATAFPRQLSLGQQRRLSLARAFAGQPDVLVMDEPFVSLDIETAEEMLSLTEELIAEHRPATVLVTHSDAEARRLADRILRLAGKPATIVGSENVSSGPGEAE